MDGLPADGSMTFVLVQHLDPTHASMMVDLLAGHTAMTVVQAADGTPIAPGHFYIIPPGTYLAVTDGVLRLSEPEPRQGQRLPFDFLLLSLAAGFGVRAVGVVLSGTGADGSLGVAAIKRSGGLVIAQDPLEASYDGMPRSAIATGTVDLVLPVAEIPGALTAYLQRTGLDGAVGPAAADEAAADEAGSDQLAAIVGLLRTRTAYDFSLYKSGTLRRRTERRMGLSGFPPPAMGGYLDRLRGDAGELDLLARDLLIHVTGFFRDPKVFELLAQAIIPGLVRDRPLDQPLRIWVAGCSTGEETYSLAILFREAIVAAGRNVRIQIFASDVDPDAVATARDGLYPATIADEMPAERLERFFVREGAGYRISAELRATVVFTVQDVLADPPFSRIDLVSCRNLLIYLRADAQAKVVALFHFALREGGLLLLGSAETAGHVDGRFELVSEAARLYRHVGRTRPGEMHFPTATGDVVRPLRARAADTGAGRPAALAELCRRLVLDGHAPAAVLIDRKGDCLYSLGPTDRYLRVAPGHPVHDLLSMARDGVRTKLRSAIQRAWQENRPVVAGGGRVAGEAGPRAFRIAIEPVAADGDDLLLICFIEEPAPPRRRGAASDAGDGPRAAELEQELLATRTELQGAIRNLELSAEEQKAINEEALSVSEEYQATNEELLASKEELQSLNEELTVLNGQLQETLDRQRITADDLQNVLYSTDVATLFLDTELRIRFFTPPTRLLFSVRPGDVGRPLADLSSLAEDASLLDDARAVLQGGGPLEREITAQSGAWYVRRILPYRTRDESVKGVVITFDDITERRRAADALETARREAQQANIAKSRFLAAASHDLRQPLQTLALLQGLLAKTVEGERPQKLLTRVDETLGAMSGMLNALLDINQIEAGTVRADVTTFPIDDLLERLRGEFTYHAQAQRLELRVVRSGLLIRSDLRLLEQMVRNLMANALKYTKRGRVLIGCRRREGMARIEVWDTGIGIPGEELQAIFEEYHQLDNDARQRSRGLGLGLSIVQRLGTLLGHRIRVRSNPGRGSVFSVEVGLAPAGAAVEAGRKVADAVTAAQRTGMILVVEDDPELREALELLLAEEGHRAALAVDGPAALELIARGAFRPDLILADYNLPNGMDGLQVAARVRERLRRPVPVVILTGDISTDTLREIARANCVQLTKPVKLKELMDVLQHLLPAPLSLSLSLSQAQPLPADRERRPVVFVVDDDRNVREALRSVLEEDGFLVEDYEAGELFLSAYRPGREACLLVDAHMPGMDGLELLRRLAAAGHRLPAIMVTGNSDVAIAVQAMQSGAIDFIEKPIGRTELLASVARALEQARDSGKRAAWQADATARIGLLTPRQRQIMDLVLAGHPSKNIAAELGLSRRTVETHRAAILDRTGARSLAGLARLALTAADPA
ncbi:protein-glutamate methylesterase [Allostella humosa]|nr:protein-glutamate methylesterase [Stella humosa]